MLISRFRNKFSREKQSKNGIPWTENKVRRYHAIRSIPCERKLISGYVALGDGKEGQILLVFSFMAAPTGAPVVFTSGLGGYPPAQHHQRMKGPAVYQSGQPVQTAIVPPLPTFSEEDLKQVSPVSLFRPYSYN